MKEAVFVRQNKAKWQEFELKLKNLDGIEPDEVALIYLEVTDDLSFARTHFSKSRLVDYLNQMATKVHQSIYRKKKEKKSRVKSFFIKEVPQTMAGLQKELLISFLVFLASFGIGWISSANDTTFVRLIMGDAYVNMTNANIAKGDPMAVYKSMEESIMFVSITFNNVTVALRTFALGALTAIGSGFSILRNGVMVGAFFQYFFAQELGFTAIMVIMIHGTLELSAIVIAGAAGIHLGNSFLFPGSYSRSESFKRAARKGLKVIIGLIPIFIIAGWLESYMTRLTEMPLMIRILIIGGSAIFILYYFIILPNQIRLNEKRRIKNQTI